MSFIYWILFSVLAIFDARENRIPNQYLCLLLCAAILEIFLSSDVTVGMSSAILGGCFFFGLGWTMYLSKAMSAGDVKLLAVVGFIVGWGSLTPVFVSICFATVMVGSFYCFQYLAYKPMLLKQSLTRYQLAAYGGLQALKQSGGKSEDKIRMPFAPIVVIGLAWHQYFY